MVENAQLLGRSTGDPEQPHPPSASYMSVFLSPSELEQVDALDGAVDMHEECGPWARSGECATNPGYMLQSCKASCGVQAPPWIPPPTIS